MTSSAASHPTLSQDPKTINPSIEDAKEYHANMAASNLARAIVNIRRASLIAFYKSHGLELKKGSGASRINYPP